MEMSCVQRENSEGEAEPGQSEQCMPEMLGDRVPRSEGTGQM